MTVHQLHDCTHPSKQFRGNNQWYCLACDTHGEYAAAIVDPLDAVIENPEFEDLWKLWPKDRKNSKGACRTLFNDTVQGFESTVNAGGKMIVTPKHGTPQEMFTGAQAYLKAKDGKFILLLETFLNKGAWEQ